MMLAADSWLIAAVILHLKKQQQYENHYVYRF